MMIDKETLKTAGVRLMLLAAIAGAVYYTAFLVSRLFDDSTTTTAGGVEPARVVVLNAPLLVRAAMASSMTDKKVAVDSNKLGSLVASTVEEYRENGYIVLAAGNAIVWPAAADITPVIAQRAGIDLKAAELGDRLLSGEVAPAGAELK